MSEPSSVRAGRGTRPSRRGHPDPCCARDSGERDRVGAGASRSLLALLVLLDLHPQPPQALQPLQQPRLHSPHLARRKCPIHLARWERGRRREHVRQSRPERGQLRGGARAAPSTTTSSLSSASWGPRAATMQENVGFPLSDEEKQRYIMMHAREFGCTEGHQPTEAGPPAQSPGTQVVQQATTSAGRHLRARVRQAQRAKTSRKSSTRRVGAS